ncbi:MAG: hypothetical protein J1E35_03895 [Lachnospiraceae bacterium]|nr:hypothetical protein [Lachnospiraceae bacterium]
MQRLRAWFYLKNNKKRAAILVVSFGLFFTLLYVVQFFLYPTYYMAEVVFIKGAEKMQVAYINSFGALGYVDLSLWEKDSRATEEELIAEINRGSAQLVQELRKDSAADYVFVCNSYNIRLNAFSGDIIYFAPMLTKDEMDIMTEYLELELAEGAFPQNPGELLMDVKMARNMGISVGDTVYDSRTKLTGIVKYDTYFAAGIDYADTVYPDRYLYFLDNGTIPDLKEFFARQGIEAGEDSFSVIQIISDRTNMTKEAREYKDSIAIPLRVMSYSIAAVLGITLFFVYRLHVQDRYAEWCLYRSLGYSEKEVYLLAFREYGICLGMGVLAAALLTVLLCGTGSVLMSARGMFYECWLPEAFMQILGIGTLLTGVMQIPVVYAMQKVKTIDAMEEE